MNSITDIKANVISALAGGAVFLVFLFSLDSVFAATGLAVAAYVGALLVLNVTQAKDTDFEMLDLTDLNDKKIDRIIKNGKQKIKAIQKAGIKIQDTSTQRQVLQLTQIAQSIFENFRNNPDDVQAASHFLPYYLNSSYKLAQKYVEISNIKIHSDKVDQMKNKINDSLITLKNSLQKQHDKLLQDDLADLDTETQILRDTIQMEDFQ